MAKNPATAHSPSERSPTPGSCPYPPMGQEWETITNVASTRRRAFKLLRLGSNA